MRAVIWWSQVKGDRAGVFSLRCTIKECIWDIPLAKGMRAVLWWVVEEFKVDHVRANGSCSPKNAKT